MSRRALPLAAALLLGAGPPAAAADLAIVHARILTAGPAGEIPDGVVVVRGGRIAAVGRGLPVPAGAQVIDAAGGVVTPGLIAASTSLTVSEVEGVSTTRDDTAGGKLGASYDISYGVNPASVLVPLARQGGITRAMVTPVAGRGFGGDAEEEAFETAGGGEPIAPASGLFAGQAAFVRLGAGDVDPVVRPRAAMVVELGDAGARVAGSHAAALIGLKTALDEARAYGARRAAFEKGESRGFALTREDLEALQPVLSREVPLLVRVHRAADIRQVLRLAREEKVRIVLEGAEEGWLLAPEIAAAGVPVLLDAEADLPEQFESLGSRLDNAARLDAAGVLIAIEGSRDFQNYRQARFNAGTAVANGLPYAAALKAVTVNPARIWGVADRVGSLEPGREADLVVWTGDPFEPSTYARAVVIGGAVQPEGGRELQLRDRYAQPDDGRPSAYH